MVARTSLLGSRSSCSGIRPLPARALRRLEEELERLAGAPVTLKRRTRAAHRDYATNVALRVVAKDGRSSARGGGTAVRAGGGAPSRSNYAPRSRGQASCQPVPRARLVRRGAGRVAGGRHGLRRRLRGETGVSLQVEARLGEPTGPLTVGSARTRPTATRLRGCSGSAGNEVERQD